MKYQRLTVIGDLIRSADAYSMVQPEEEGAEEQGERPLVKAKDALGALDTFVIMGESEGAP